MTEVGESGFEVALGGSDIFGVLMAHMIVKKSNSDLRDENEGRDDVEIQSDVPFRGSSLMEEDEEEDDIEEESEDEPEECDEIEVSHSLSLAEENDRFHPDLMKSLQAEGQEAMWMEDEVSTVASVYVKPVSLKRFSFMQSKKEEKIHVRKKKITKTVVLLPSQDEEVEQTLVDACAQEEAAVNIIKARELLNEALHAGSESEAMARTAFEHAATARRLMSTAEDAPDLEAILTVLKEKGEEAVAKSKKSNGRISDYARKALHCMESILPSNVENNVSKSASIAEDSVSTLGLQTDTFEYQLGVPSQAPSQLTSYHNMDLMSISSLNEILDGPIAEAIEKTLSPRQMLPEIHIPTNKTTRSGAPLSRNNETAKPANAGCRNETKKIKKWGILKKFRRAGKVGKCQLPEVDEEPTFQTMDEPMLPSIDENEERGCVKEVDVLPLQSVEELPYPEILALQEAIPEPAELVTAQSTASESKSKGSKASRYHIVVEQKPSQDASSVASSVSSSSSDTSGTSSDASEVLTSRSAESIYRLDTVKSDWDQSINFRRNPKARATVTAETKSDGVEDEVQNNNDENSAALKTSRSTGIIPEPVALDPSVFKRTPGDGVESVKAERIKMHQKSIANLSGEESTQTTSKAESIANQTPISKHGASVGSNGTRTTNDIRSTLGNAGIETIAESVFPSEAKHDAQSVQSSVQISRSSRSARSSASKESKESMHSNVEEFQLRSDPDGSKDDATIAPTIASHRKIRPVSSEEKDSFRSGNRSRESQSVFEPPIAAMFRVQRGDDSTRGENDSLIDFVISPRRANIVTPGGTKPFVTYREDEPPKALIRTLPAISEKPFDRTNHETEDEHRVKPMKRFPVIFGHRTGKVPLVLEKPHFKNVKQEEEHLTPVAELSVTDDQCMEDEKEDVLMLKKVLSEAVSKAEEANMEVMTAPFPHKRYRHRKVPGETRPVPNDLVEAIRMQSGRENKRTARTARESIGDAPGISFSIDPEIDTKGEKAPPRMDPLDEVETDIRILAPTPRNRPTVDHQACENIEGNAGGIPVPECQDEEQQVKYAQRKVTERLYGPIQSNDSFIGNHTKIEVNKGVYIGDLLRLSHGEPDTEPSGKEITSVTGANEVVEDKENEAVVLSSPKVSAAPKRARRSMFGLRRNVLPIEH